MVAEVVSWGDWMQSWKSAEAGSSSGPSAADREAERIDRQRAAFGGDTVARIKDLNVLIVGCRGVGVETAKNLILSNVGAAVLWDNGECEVADMGTNFYLAAEDCESGGKTSRARASLADLKSLNPYCRVDVHDGPELTDEYLTSPDVLGTGRPFAAVVVTDLLPKSDLLRMNETARSNGIAFILALNKGVTASIFSDFGSAHEITDATGEPAKMLAVSNVEVLDSKPATFRVDGVEDGSTVVVVTVAQSEHGLDDGDVVALDDLRDAMAGLNGKQFKVKRCAFLSPTAAELDTRDVVFTEALKQPTADVLRNFERQYDFYRSQFEQDAGNEGKKFPVRTITMFNRLALVLPEGESVDSFRSYEAGGLLQQVRPPIQKSYKSLAETLERTPVPQMLRGEDWEGGVGVDVHLCYAAALDFRDAEGRWPSVHSSSDASKFLEYAQKVSDARKDSKGTTWAQKINWGFPTGEPRDLDARRVRRFSRLFGCELTGLCSYLGGAAAQEVLKKTGKFTPIDGWIHHDEQCLVGAAADSGGGAESENDGCEESNVSPRFGSRYDHQIAVMGKDFQRRASDFRVFLVGCGALGCEYLKGMALMGVGTGKNGKVIVTDMDRIEVSNLSRQFLFRDSDVGTPKSVSGARVVRGWNPRMNVSALERKVGPDTEDHFDDDFWESLDLCWNALDNVAARRYTDSRCLLYGKPLLESGTLGTKCNHEVILPYRTSTYGDGKESDENENQIAMCTLRSFPYLPLHCIEFAKQAYFSDYFEFGPDQYETFRRDRDGFFEQLESMQPNEQLKSLKTISYYIQLQSDNGGKTGGRAIDFEVCVRLAFERMIADFRTSVLNLCHAADSMEKSTGKKFWTGTKRRPRAADWRGSAPGESMPALVEYLYCASNLYAAVWGVEPVRGRTAFEEVSSSMGLTQPKWAPASEGVDLSEEDNAEEGGGGDSAEEVEKLKGELYGIDTASLQPAAAHDFEKDDDANFHIDFLTAATNLRAWNYDIRASKRHDVKVTAGRIIPALATTTAMVCGLVDVEFCKLVLGLQSSMGRAPFLNSNINLAAGSGNFTSFTPDPPIWQETGLKEPYPEKFTSWDKMEVLGGRRNGEMSTEQLVAHIERTFGMTVVRLFEHGSKADRAIYDAVDREKLDWKIEFDEAGKVTVSEGVFAQWPQIRMAAQMLSRLPPSSNQRKVFVSQVENVKRALEKTKAGFAERVEGAVSEVYRTTYEPEDEAEKKYFHAVFGKRDYVLLDVHGHTKDEEDVRLPCIKYVFSRDAKIDNQNAG